MGIRQLFSGAFQVRFQHAHTSYAASYPIREFAEDAVPLLRAAVLADHRETTNADHDAIGAPRPAGPTPDLPPAPPLEDVCLSSAAAAESIDTILADVVSDHVDRAPVPDEVLTTGQAAVLLGVSRPTLVSWLEAGRIPFHRRGAHRRVHRSHVLAFHEQIQRSSGRRQPSPEPSPGGGCPMTVDLERRQDRLSLCG
ncbi:MAG: helix-turn-helix domain-containing protein [Nitriliruptoraceae bacterium]